MAKTRPPAAGSTRPSTSPPPAKPSTLHTDRIATTSGRVDVLRMPTPKNAPGGTVASSDPLTRPLLDCLNALTQTIQLQPGKYLVALEPLSIEVTIQGTNGEGFMRWKKLGSGGPAGTTSGSGKSGGRKGRLPGKSNSVNKRNQSKPYYPPSATFLASEDSEAARQVADHESEPDWMDPYGQD